MIFVILHNIATVDSNNGWTCITWLWYRYLGIPWPSHVSVSSLNAHHNNRRNINGIETFCIVTIEYNRSNWSGIDNRLRRNWKAQCGLQYKSVLYRKNLAARKCTRFNFFCLFTKSRRFCENERWMKHKGLIYCYAMFRKLNEFFS